MELRARATLQKYRNREELRRLIAVGLRLRGDAFKKTKTYKRLQISLTWMEKGRMKQ